MLLSTVLFAETVWQFERVKFFILNIILQISKDDFLPKKICERCILRLEQFYEWKAICVQSDTVLRNYSESMRAVTATINFQVFSEYNKRK